MIPIASFLAGALLSLLLPTLLLIALVAWYDRLFRRGGEPADVSDLRPSAAEAGGTPAGERPGPSGTAQPPADR